MSAGRTSSPAKYTLNTNGRFVIENYNKAKPFSNFFPGIAGVWGIPMWVFYVNRGQCIASFGVESKDKAIMEFQPANKSYRVTSLQGFRTFIKAISGSKTIYWEPFQNHLEGTDFKKKQTLSISAHDLTLQETNIDLGLTVTVNYFTLPEESYPALVRRVTVKNIGRKDYTVDLIDGLPAIIPYGLNDMLNKNISRTVEAWVKVGNLAKKAPYYRLNVEVSDRPEVTHIKEGNFFFSFDPRAKSGELLDPIVESACVFGKASDYLAPERFYQKHFKLPEQQQTSNRTPSAMCHARFRLKKKAERQIISLFGHAHDEDQLNKIVLQAAAKQFIDSKADGNKRIIDGVKNFALTKSSSSEFDLFSAQTFLDNTLRGGLPVSLRTSDGAVAFNVYSRKHGDLERDYNYFFVSPTFFSQGNGNYRDVNQNRRNDVWFNADVRSGHLMNFLNLSQADGYNPLIIKGTAFSVCDEKRLQRVLSECVDKKDRDTVGEFIRRRFTPGDLLKFIAVRAVRLSVDPKAFLGRVLEACRGQELVDHGEGFWSDHWTYNLDLIESYLSVYPEDLKGLLLERRAFHFYHNPHHILPRDRRYLLTDRGVRQYESVANDPAVDEGLLRRKSASGDVYRIHLMGKILCLIANKAASLDPSGIGVEMEADKPNWYDALNGLPGLLGSSVSESLELKRLNVFLLEAIERLGCKEEQDVLIFKELANFISGLTNILLTESDPQVYWQKSNDLKEHYREYIRHGIEGSETSVEISDIKHFLNLVIARVDKGVQSAVNGKGFLATYFCHDVVKYKPLEKAEETDPTYVQPLKFRKHALPLFLEGYVHALRVEKSHAKAQKLYRQVRKSGLYDKKLKMYKVNTSLAGESEEIGRARIFPSGWLENESIWLHMEYKFLLELLRCELYEEFYQNFKSALVPFLNPEQYGRSILENSSFIVSSAHKDTSLHGRGFVARLSGSTAEFVHIWLLMNVGKNPFSVNAKGELSFTLKPALAGWLFTKGKTTVTYLDHENTFKKAELPKNCYAFNLFGSTLVVYHNPRRRNTFGAGKPVVTEIQLFYPGKKQAVIIPARSVVGQHAQDIRDRKVERIDVFLR